LVGEAFLIVALPALSERYGKAARITAVGVNRMSILDGILGQIDGNIDVANMAAKLGIDESVAEKAIAALGQAHQESEDTVADARLFLPDREVTFSAR